MAVSYTHLDVYKRQTIRGILNNEITPEKQNEEETCYASMLNKEIA